MIGRNLACGKLVWQFRVCRYIWGGLSVRFCVCTWSKLFLLGLSSTTENTDLSREPLSDYCQINSSHFEKGGGKKLSSTDIKLIPCVLADLKLNMFSNTSGKGPYARRVQCLWFPPLFYPVTAEVQQTYYQSEKPLDAFMLKQKKISHVFFCGGVLCPLTDIWLLRVEYPDAPNSPNHGWLSAPQCLAVAFRLDFCCGSLHLVWHFDGKGFRFESQLPESLKLMSLIKLLGASR